MNNPVLTISHLSHRYGKTVAVDDVSFSLNRGATVALVGPDGVGKSTLLSLIAGTKKQQAGDIVVLGKTPKNQRDRNLLNFQVAFMPQGLGRNLYPTLTVMENIDFAARLYSLPEKERLATIDRLLKATGLFAFKERPAGKLSGGMKQKLSLCCALIHQPEILILDEPTTGVDPLSRRQFWELTDKLRSEFPQMTMIVATAYMEEAERFDYLLAMNNGKLLAADRREIILEQTKSKTVEDAYRAMLPEKSDNNQGLTIPPFVANQNEEPVIVAKNLVKRFGDFTAANNVSFTIQKGEIFGFLGSNGCGKSTTMKMLTGLLQADEGEAVLFGHPVNADDKETRNRVGYMSQAFSLYEELTVRQNLTLTAAIYPNTANCVKASVQDALQRFDLIQYEHSKPADLPLGIRQRLQLAAACIHRPELLILDEPTSGVDPVARDMFWRQLIDLSRQDKTTIFVSTHFMNEAALCDRISLMHAGEVLAADTPENLRQHFQAATLEEAFIQCLEDNGANESAESAFDEIITHEENTHKINKLAAWFSETLTFARREALELMRDRVRLFFAAAGPLVILFCIALCVSFDIDEVPFAVADHDKSTDSQKLVQEFAGSPYFVEQSPLTDFGEIDTALQNGKTKLVIDIPANFGRDLNAGRKPQIAYHIDGTQPFTATAISGYIGGISATHIANMLPEKSAAITSITEPRFIYNQEFKSIYAIAPAVLMMALLMIPTMLTAVGVVREKELGSILNFYTSPVSGSQYLIGKQLPYIGLGCISGLILLFFIIFILGVPLKGSLITLLAGILLFVSVATAIGLFVSCFVNTQVAALFAAGILVMIPSVNFSGMIYPVATLEGSAAVISQVFPASWFQLISLGTFTKGVGFSVLWKMFAVLGVQLIVLMTLSVKLLKKWEK